VRAQHISEICVISEFCVVIVVCRGRHGGMWFDLKPWQTHVFELSLL